MIAAERRRQVFGEDWSAAHDDQHTDLELVMAAVCYALPHTENVPERWPWQDEEWKPSGDYIRDLVKAGALIAAEIDRELRARGEA